MSYKISILQKSFPYLNIVTDIMLIVMTLVLRYYSEWFTKHISTFYWFVGLLQSLAIYAILVGESPVGGGNTGIRIIDKLFWLSTPMLIISIGGFLWFFLPPLVLKTDISGKALILNFFVGLFGSLLALSFSTNKRYESQLTIFDKIFNPVFLLLYLIISEIMIYTSAHHQNGGLVVSLFAMSLSYLPIRFLMILKPPFSSFDILTGLGGLVYFIYSLL